MSWEQTQIIRAGPHLVTNKARDLIRDEISKGCRPEISPEPVSLEPVFQPIWTIKDLPSIHHQALWTADDPATSDDLIRLHVWISPEQSFDWNRCELFLKKLQGLSYRTGFEVFGNNEGLTMAFLVHRYDQPIFSATFLGGFESCEISPIDEWPLSSLSEDTWNKALFRDYLPPPPYSHLLTQPPELQLSPLQALIRTMSTIEPPLVGLYQVIFQTVSADHNWHLNVEKLSDLEYTLKLQDGINTPQRYAQQAPSGDLKQMSSEVESKAHNDKPFFSMAMRIGVIGESSGANDILRSLSTFSSLFQHGGRPMNYLTEKEYKRQLSVSQIRDMFTIGSTHRPGFLVNSWELTGPVHIPPLNINEHLQLPLKGLETLPVRNPALLTGTWIGNCDYAGISDRVCIPEEPRQRSTHLIGRSGMGKTTVQEHMILSDIERGDGVAVLDPHGDLVERIIRLIPEEHAGRTIYFNPGDPEWVPIWNPLEPIPGQDSAQTADDIVQAIRSFVSSGGWGDRLENILRHIIFALLHLPKSTFLDISDLLRNKSDESKILRREILKVVDNETARQFWRHDYDKYSKDDLGPPKNKLSKLLVSGTVSLMLSQPDNQINFRQIMDQGSIFLVNLSTVGPMIRGILGCFILSLLHLTALSRSNIPKEERKQFHIHCDEAHRFMTDSLEDLIAETRKYRVSLSLAHQFMKQFAQKKTDAFSSVGSTIMFNVDSRDAAYLIKDLRGLVKVDDLTSLGIGEAIVRIGTDIVRTKMRDILKPPENNLRDQIISESRKKYYKPVHEVRKLIRWRGDRWSSPFSSPILIHPEDNYGADDEFIYDEF